MSKTRTASVYTRENEPPYAFRRVKEGQGHRTGSLTGPFYTRPFVNGKQRWNALVGAETFEQAKAMANKGVDVLNASAKGLVVEGVEEITGGDRLSVKVEAFLTDTKANKKHTTWKAYKNSMRLFLESCKKTHIDAINREDLITFKNQLRAAELSERSCHNIFGNAMIFLK